MGRHSLLDLRTYSLAASSDNEYLSHRKPSPSQLPTDVQGKCCSNASVSATGKARVSSS